MANGWLSYSTRAMDGVPSYGDARAFFPPCVVRWVRSFCRVVCDGLERQSGTGLRYLLAITLAPTGSVNFCTVQVLLSSRGAGIVPLSHFLVLYRYYYRRGARA